jgi:hypothetical protein
MYLIDKNKDYYDYLSGIYGVDKCITYDRRGSIPLTKESFLKLISPYYTKYNNDHGSFFVLEVGYFQYLFQGDIQYRPINPYMAMEPYKGVFKLWQVFDEQKHYYEKEITIIPVTIKWPGSPNSRKKRNYIDTFSFSELRRSSEKISNPILINTPIPSLIDPFDIWSNVSNYISSKYNDKTIDIYNTDTEKIINHGFDKKISFRHPIKINN